MPDHPTNPAVRLTAGDFYARNPEPHYAWMRANAPLYRDEPGDVWGVSTYDLVRAVSKDAATFANGGGIRPNMGPTPMLIDLDDPAHWARRKLINRGFTPRRVRDQEPRIREVCNGIIDDVAERGSCDFVGDVAALLPMIMIGDALGVAAEDRATLLRWSDDLLKGQDSDATEDQLEVMVTAFADYSAYISEVIADRRARPRDDLVSILVHAEVDGQRLSDDDLVYDTLLILVGGDETTRHVISQGVYELLRTGQWADLLEDRSLVPGAVEEMLRWVTPIKNMCRTATRDVELAGHQVREGDELLLLYASANRDETVFADPETFDIRRSPNDHVAFGFGAHFCLGNSLARLEIKVMLEQLLDRLPDLTLATDDPPPLRPANFVSGPESLPVTFTPTSA
jgi:cytochrome P450 family 142 subfamily A polypeptide 1